MLVRPYKVETVVDGRHLSECFVSAHDVHSTKLGMVYFCFCFVLFSSF